MTRNEQRRFDRLHDQLLRALKRHGKARKTIDAYARGVRRLAAFVDHCPDDLSVEELNAYFDQLIDSHGWSTVKIDRNGIRFFYEHILDEPMPWLQMVVPPKWKTLPDVLTVEEIARLIAVTRECRYRVSCLATYSMGLRLGETLNLEVGDIDRERMRVHLRLAKGNKDRFVVLPAVTLRELRALWCTHRHPSLLFPGRPAPGGGPATAPMDRGNTQRAFRRAAADARIRKRVSIHSRRHTDPQDADRVARSAPVGGPGKARHSYATHLVEAGLNLRAVQDQLGHASPETTARYVRITERSRDNQEALINTLVDSLSRAVRRATPAEG